MRNQASRERQSVFGIEDCAGLGKIPAALSQGRHEAGLRAGIAVSRPLVADKKIEAVPSDEVRNSQRTAERRHTLQVVGGRLGRILPGEGKRACIQEGVVQNHADTGVVRRPAGPAVVAECLGLREWRGCAVVHASVDGEDIGGAATQVAGNDATGFVFRLRGVAGGIQIRTLKTGLRASRLRLLSLGFGLLPRLTGWESGDRWRDGLLGDRWRRGRCCSFDFIERQQFHIPFGAGHVRRDCHFLFHRKKTQHLDLNRPGPIRQARERVGALLIGDGQEFLIALSRRYGCAGKGQAAEFNLAMVLGRREPEHRQPAGGAAAEIALPCH